MRRLIKNIERALYQHECVIVPGLGALLRRDLSAVLDESKGMILPGRTALSFNAALNEQDGILVHAYMQAYAMGYKRAQSLLENDVRELIQQLRSSGIIQLGSIGRLIMDRHDGRITFLPNADHPFDITYYGLMPIARLRQSIAHLDQNNHPHRNAKLGRNDILYLPINLRAIRYGFAAAILLLALLLVPTARLTTPDGKVEYHAGFLLPSTQHSSSVSIGNHRHTPHNSTQKNTTELVSEEKDDSQGTPQYQIAGLEAHNTKKLLPNEYFVIIASLRSERQVQKFVEHYRPQDRFEHLGVLVSPSGMMRIYVSRHSDESSARDMLNNTVLPIPDYSASWIYESK